MQRKRRHPSEVTPHYEDIGLFKTHVHRNPFDLVPEINRNQRGDVSVRAFVSDTTAVSVVFAGRRAKFVEPLLHELKRAWTLANRRVADGLPPPDVDQVRFRADIEGAWRPRFVEDDEGWQTRYHHFLVSRWRFTDWNGVSKDYGEAPVVRPPASAAE